MTDKEFNIVGHALGVDVYSLKKSRFPDDLELPDRFYRNYYAIGEANRDKSILDGLVISGIMTSGEKFGNLVYLVTNPGQARFREQFKADVIDKAEPVKAPELNYERFLRRDGDQSFPEFLGIKLPVYEYGRSSAGYTGLVRMVSTKYPEVKGGYRKLKKDAKFSYKQKLKEFHEKRRKNEH
jgi:hypothetical protein